MTMRANFSLVLFAMFLFSAPGRSGLVREPPAASALLGNLKIKISKVDRSVQIGDSFSGSSSDQQFGKVHVKIRNVGDFPACAALVPSIEEYKGSELQYTQDLKTDLHYNPKIKNLAPGAEASGYYDFTPSPQKRDYVLVLGERDATQRCNTLKNAKSSDTGFETVSGSRIVRLPLKNTR
jgi:hypothetical protein